MTTQTRREIARDPLVRTAGSALLSTYTAAAALVLWFTPMLPVGTRTSPGALAAVLLAPVVLLVLCAAGVLGGWRWPAVPAVVLLVSLSLLLVQVLPVNAVLVALLVLAFVRIGRLRADPPGSRVPRKRLPAGRANRPSSWPP